MENQERASGFLGLFGRRQNAAAAPHERPKLEERLLQAYKQFCYRILGQRLDARPDLVLASRLHQAAYGVTPGLYHALLVVTCLGAMLVTMPVFAAIFGLVTGHPQWYLLMVILAGLTGLASAAAFPFAVSNRIGNRRHKLEQELPFTLSELSVMASIGLSPIELVRRMAKRPHDPHMTGEFKRVVFKTDVQGKDLITALAETAKESPSDLLRQTLWDLANMIHQGGDLDEYLRNQSAEVLEKKRVAMKDFIGQLGTYSDMYVTVVLIGIMFMGVGAFLLDSFGSTAGGLSADALLLLLTYGIVPMIILVVALLLNSAHGKSGGEGA